MPSFRSSYQGGGPTTTYRCACESNSFRNAAQNALRKRGRVADCRDVFLGDFFNSMRSTSVSEPSSTPTGITAMTGGSISLVFMTFTRWASLLPRYTASDPNSLISLSLSETIGLDPRVLSNIGVLCFFQCSFTKSAILRSTSDSSGGLLIGISYLDSADKYATTSHECKTKSRRGFQKLSGEDHMGGRRVHVPGRTLACAGGPACALPGGFTRVAGGYMRRRPAGRAPPAGWPGRRARARNCVPGCTRWSRAR